MYYYNWKILKHTPKNKWAKYFIIEEQERKEN